MLAEAAGVSKIIIACGRTDLRKGIDGLAQLIGTKYDRNNGRAAIIDLVKYSREHRHLEATGTDGIVPQNLQLRNILAEHYNQAESYIERMQAHIPYGTVRKTLAIRENCICYKCATAHHNPYSA